MTQRNVEQITQEVRINSSGDNRIDWLFGVFYSETERNYAQRLPTPGYDAYTDAAFGAGVSAAVANGYEEVDSPYNSDLPYDIEQFAVFGEVTLNITEALRLTVGGRYYDFKEERIFNSGGLFSNGDNQFDKTDSNGFKPRFLGSFDISDNITLNAQAAQGFRLGGVNDPLNQTLCTAGDLETFGSFQSYKDETMWNYEVGVKAEFERASLQVAGFYADIKNLQVALDAGSCSSRISFNVEEAHSAGAEVELTVRPADRLEMTVAGSLVESEFGSTVRSADGNIIGGVEDGNRLASVPEFQMSGNATYTVPTPWFNGADFFLQATVQHVGDRITQPSD